MTDKQLQKGERRVVLLTIAAGILGLLILMGIAYQINQQGLPSDKATRNLSAYSVINGSDVTNSSSKYIGQYTLVPLEKNQAIRDDQVRSADDVQLASRTMVTISSKDPLVLNDKVSVGDRIDLSVPDQNGTASQPAYTDVYVLDILKSGAENSTSRTLVLAVNQGDVSGILANSSKGSLVITRKLS